MVRDEGALGLEQLAHRAHQSNEGAEMIGQGEPI